MAIVGVCLTTAFIGQWLGMAVEQAEVPKLSVSDKASLDEVVADGASGGDDTQDRWLIEKIVSGGQTGVDRAALDWACQRGVAHGGWCPKGRLAADGPLPSHYQLSETDSANYRQRTKLNVRDSDATLIFNMGLLHGGTLRTVRFAQAMVKPHLVVQLDETTQEAAALQIRAWLTTGRFGTLNVAGPREDKRPRIYLAVAALLDACFMEVKPPGDARKTASADRPGSLASSSGRAPGD